MEKWEIDEKDQVKSIKIGFKRQMTKVERTKMSKEEFKRIKKALLLGQHGIDSVQATRQFMASQDRLDFVDRVQVLFLFF